jgi:hypothetical protein
LPAFERGRNLEGQHNSKCDVKDHLKVKYFRCNTYKKRGGTPRPSNVWAFRRANPFPFKLLRTRLRNWRSASPFLSITCALFPLRRRVYPLSSQSGTHPPPYPCPTMPLIFNHLRIENFASPLFSYSSMPTCQRQTLSSVLIPLPHYFVSLPIRPIAAKGPWCHN